MFEILLFLSIKIFIKLISISLLANNNLTISICPLSIASYNGVLQKKSNKFYKNLLCLKWY